MIITNEELADLCNSIQEGVPIYYGSAFRLCFNLLYKFGFRINELSLVHQWNILSHGVYVCPTEKGGNDREIEYLDPTGKINQSIMDGENYVFTRDWRAYSRYINSKTGGNRYKHNDKFITTHLFRHNYIKKLSEDGKTVSEIKTITGLIDTNVVNGYINSEINQVGTGF